MSSIHIIRDGNKELLVREDGYINATALCKRANKSFAHYRENKTTTAFLKELSLVMGIPISSLVQTSHGVQKGSTPQEQGTWIHPDVAPNLGQWLNPSYAVWVAQTVRRIHSGELELKQSGLKGLHYTDRMMTNESNLDKGYFSIIDETYRVYKAFEGHGFVIPDYAKNGQEIRPDVSVGRRFPKWLEFHHSEFAKSWKYYFHVFPNNLKLEPRKARQYENIVLGPFKTFLEDVWLPEVAPEYFKARAPKALDVLPKMLN